MRRGQIDRLALTALPQSTISLTPSLGYSGRGANDQGGIGILCDRYSSLAPESKKPTKRRESAQVT
jgi:hypothetical protein